MKLHHVPLRLATGAFVLNSGLSKWKASEEQATHLHGFAATAYPEVKRLRPEQFTRALSAWEIAVGAALLTPFVPPAIAGAGLTAFSAGLVGLYLRTPGMRREGSLQPTQEGLSLAKDAWMLAIGVELLADGLFGRKRK